MTIGRVVLQVTLALWLGGSVWLMAGVQTMFAKARHVAVEAAPILFAAFEWYQVGLGVVGVTVATWLWRRSRSRGMAAVTGCLAAGLVLACVSAFVITPRVDALRLAGEGGSAAFRSLHGISMALYLAVACCVLVAMVFATISRKSDGLSPGNG